MTRSPQAPAFARKVDAERFLAGVESAKVIGTYVNPALANVTVGVWAQRWLDGQAHLKPTTRSRYEGVLRKHIIQPTSMPPGRYRPPDRLLAFLEDL